MARSWKYVYLVGYRCRYVSGEVHLSDEHIGFQWVNTFNFRQLNDRDSPPFRALEMYFGN
jgi:hypothetical protein